MNAETELLPLPESDGLNDIYGECHHYYYADTLQAYARANMEKWKVPCLEWLDKTEWVQQTIKPRELGRHRADILRERIQQAEASAERLEEALRNILRAALDGCSAMDCARDAYDALDQEDRNGNE